ncbi:MULTISPECIES: SoxR reducing system RseC family protein [Rheinheimera]|uniref:SoxR reducing system RseC family protein n=1 Tax=Rheinheimera marina TaxID=1774958 RepID=A0ABV9JJA3_9GAMM
MLEEIAVVVKTDAEGVWLKTQAKTSCNACQANDNCGTGVVAKALTPRENVFFVAGHTNLLAGQTVQIAVTEQQLLSAAALVYLWPLACLILSALLLQHLQLPDSTVTLGALTAMGLAFALIRLRRQQSGPEPVQILKVLPQISLQHR